MSLAADAVVTALAAAIAAEPAATGVTVSEIPLLADTPNEHISIQSVNGFLDPEAMTPTFTEEMTITIDAFTTKPGGTSTTGAATRTRAFALAGAIFDALQGDPKLGGAASFARVTGYDYAGGVTDPPGHWARVTVTVEARAHQR